MAFFRALIRGISRYHFTPTNSADLLQHCLKDALERVIDSDLSTRFDKIPRILLL